MEAKEVQRICEAILFAAGEPVETERLSFVTETDPDEIRAVMKELMDLYAFERRGIRILRLEDSWQMCSQNDLAPWVTRALETRKPPKLSASQLETLTIIAYYQPTTKAFVEKLRGVDSSYSVSALLNKKLIEENGRLDAPGRPILYVTTPDFLRTFGLESLADLPEMEKVQFSADPVGADEAPVTSHQSPGHVGAVIGRPSEAEASDSAVGGDAHIGPVIAAGDDAAAVRRQEASGDASLWGMNPVGAGVPDGPQSPPEADASDEAPVTSHQSPGHVGAVIGRPSEAEASDSAVGADAHIGPVIAAGDDAAAARRQEASGDASLRGMNPVGAGVPDGPQSPPEAEASQQPEGGTNTE